MGSIVSPSVIQSLERVQAEIMAGRRAISMLLLKLCAERFECQLAACVTEQRWPAPAQKARACAIYVAATDLQWLHTEIAGLFELPADRVRKQVAHVVTLRDECPATDVWLERLGHVVRGDVS